MILEILKNVANFRLGCSHKKGTYLKMNEFTLKDFLFMGLGAKKKGTLKQIAELEFKEGKNFLFKTIFYIDMQI
jgi:hypothetical protein